MAVADITLSQLGGSRRLSAMVGAHGFYSDNNGQTLTFKFKMCKEANYVKITLNAMDTYDIEFVKIGRLNKKTFQVPVKTVKTYEGVYADNLRDVFESFTGLYITL